MPFLLFKRIKQARVIAGLSQQELAEKLGVSDKTISAYELGRAIPPSTTIAKIATITGVPLNDFFSNSNKGTSLEDIDKKLDRLEKRMAEMSVFLSKILKKEKRKV